MTRSVSFTRQFERDVKLARKRGKDLDRLRDVIALVVAGGALPPALRDHTPRGEWSPSRDIHIEPDWILIYTPSSNAVRFERMGTHSDLFGKAMPNNCCVNFTVIASVAKQSRGHSTRPLDCFVARAPRNDGQWRCSRSRLSYFWASPK